MRTALFFILLLLPALCFAQIPSVISYQGIITDSTGGVRPDGVYVFDFALYPHETGGQALWREEQKILQVKNGHFITYLGNAVALDTLSFHQPYWLAITVNGQLQTSRLPFTSVAYAFRSAVADSSVRAAHAVNSSHAVRSDSANFSLTSNTAAHATVSDSSAKALSADHSTLAQKALTADTALVALAAKSAEVAERVRSAKVSTIDTIISPKLHLLDSASTDTTLLQLTHTQGTALEAAFELQADSLAIDSLHGSVGIRMNNPWGHAVIGLSGKTGSYGGSGALSLIQQTPNRPISFSVQNTLTPLIIQPDGSVELAPATHLTFGGEPAQVALSRPGDAALQLGEQGFDSVLVRSGENTLRIKEQVVTAKSPVLAESFLFSNGGAIKASPFYALPANAADTVRINLQSVFGSTAIEGFVFAILGGAQTDGIFSLYNRPGDYTYDNLSTLVAGSWTNGGKSDPQTSGFCIWLDAEKDEIVMYVTSSYLRGVRLFLMAF